MFCLKCGKEIDNNAMRCPYCDCPTENTGVAIDTTTIDPTIKSAKSIGITAIIFGALGILAAVAAIGWIFSGIGLALALVGRNQNKFEKTCKIGLILSAIALGCSLLVLVLMIMML